MDRLTRIGFFDPSRSAGGTTRYLDSILKGIEPEEFEVLVFGHKDGPYRSRDGITFIELAGSVQSDDGEPKLIDNVLASDRSRLIARKLWDRNAPPVFKLWLGFHRQCVQLANIFQQYRIDLFHTNNTGCEESAVAAAYAHIPRILGTFHVDSTYDLRGIRGDFGHRTLEYLSNHSLHRAIAVSEATKADWVQRTKLSPGGITCIANGIDPEFFLRRTDREFSRKRLGLPTDGALVIGGIGRLDEAKGFSHLLDAAASLRGQGYKLTLAIAGDGPLRRPLTEQAEKLGIPGIVHFLGFRQDVREVFAALDIFVLSSLCEALPFALLEAMAMELPAVGTRVGGVPEVIVPDESGFLVPPRDSEALAAAIRPLLESAELRHRMGQAGCERVIRHFHEKDMVRRTIDIYREMLRDMPGSRDDRKARSWSEDSSAPCGNSLSS